MFPHLKQAAGERNHHDKNNPEHRIANRPISEAVHVNSNQPASPRVKNRAPLISRYLKGTQKQTATKTITAAKQTPLRLSSMEASLSSSLWCILSEHHYRLFTVGWSREIAILFGP
jgi:hypothetical protein